MFILFSSVFYITPVIDSIELMLRASNIIPSPVKSIVYIIYSIGIGSKV
jgi:hypothetical protein